MRYETRARIRILAALLLYAIFTYSLDAGYPLGGLGFGSVLLYGLLQAGMAFWVYFDAKRRDIENPALWYFAVVLPAIGVFGLVAYLLHRRTAPGD